MMKARKGVVKATIISAEPLKKKNLDIISSAIVDLAGVNKTVHLFSCPYFSFHVSTFNLLYHVGLSFFVFV